MYIIITICAECIAGSGIFGDVWPGCKNIPWLRVSYCIAFQVAISAALYLSNRKTLAHRYAKSHSKTQVPPLIEHKYHQTSRQTRQCFKYCPFVIGSYWFRTLLDLRWYNIKDTVYNWSYHMSIKCITTSTPLQWPWNTIGPRGDDLTS